MIYQFEKLAKKFDEWGFPKLETDRGFKVIKGVDFEKAYKSGSISFEIDGIYLKYEGKKYRGYMFIQQAYINYNGGPAKFPKFHIHKCRTIQEFINTGRFQQRYEFSNSAVNNLEDKQSGSKYKDIKLDLCSYCKTDFLEDFNDTKDFFDSLDKSETVNDSIQVDIFGYVRGKEKLSKAFREKKNYTCESCKIQPIQSNHRRYWHTHHKDGNKTNNYESNLECLCILCHSYKDIKHEDNFSKNRMKIELDSFINLYKDSLVKLKNPFLLNLEIDKKK